MRQFINPDKVIEAYIREPYESEGMLYESDSHGWQVVLVVGYTNDSYPINIVLNEDSKNNCLKIISKLNLVTLL